MSNNILKKKGFFSNLFSRYLSKRYPEYQSCIYTGFVSFHALIAACFVFGRVRFENSIRIKFVYSALLYIILCLFRNSLLYNEEL